jgi:hypothetical protein
MPVAIAADADEICLQGNTERNRALRAGVPHLDARVLSDQSTSNGALARGECRP